LVIKIDEIDKGMIVDAFNQLLKRMDCEVFSKYSASWYILLEHVSLSVKVLKDYMLDRHQKQLW